MDTLQKVKVLGDAAKYDVCLSSCIGGGRRKDPNDPFYRWIYPTPLPDGRTTFLLKILLSNKCENNCLYCANRVERDFKRISFEPDELAKFFIELYNQGLVQGLFLSSAISEGTSQTMEKMIKVVEILRYKFHFSGYVHLKILPAADFGAVEMATQLANRVSLNLEAPSKDKLNLISKKDFWNDLVKRMEWVHMITLRKNLNTSQTTQFVVGASQESDSEILHTAYWLYKKLNLARAYFSAFQPVPNTPLESHPPTPLLREHRLYQADYLLRRYGFKIDELSFDENGNLPLDLDPKMTWALKNPDKFPVEINRKNKEELLRVPGIGEKSVSRIIKKKDRFHNLEELKEVGVVTTRAAPFILINGKSPVTTSSVQLNLWS